MPERMTPRLTCTYTLKGGWEEWMLDQQKLVDPLVFPRAGALENCLSPGGAHLEVANYLSLDVHISYLLHNGRSRMIGSVLPSNTRQ